VPWITTVCGIILSAFMWYSLSANEDLIIHQKTSEVAASLKHDIERHFAEQLAALGRMAKRWEVRGGTPRTEWEQDALKYAEDHSGYGAIAIIDSDLNERWRISIIENSASKKREFPINASTKPHFERAKKSQEITVFIAAGAKNSDHFLAALLPLKKAGKADGCLAVRINVGVLLNDTIRHTVAGDYAIEAYYQQSLIFQHKTHLITPTDKTRNQLYVDLPDTSFRLNVWPTTKATEAIRSGLPEIGLLAGILFSGLLGFTIHLYQRAGRRRRRQAAAQQELNVALEQLQNANRAKSDFLARMSHELRTPLNAIIGFSQIIKDEHFGELSNKRYLEYAKYIHDSGTHLLDLISDVLDLSKIEAGERDIQREAIDLGETIREQIHLFSHEAKNNGVSLKFDAEAVLPPLNADRRAVKQMLSNLLSNAIKFTPDGGEVAVYANATYEAIRIDVTDTGMGMTEREVKIALAPFQQVGNPLTSDDLGTGLGLPIVKSLMDLHDGRLAIISNPRTGTRVTLSFPR